MAYDNCSFVGRIGEATTAAALRRRMTTTPTRKRGGTRAWEGRFGRRRMTMKTETSRDNEHEEDIATRSKFKTLCEGAGTTSTKKTSRRGQSSRRSVRGSRRCRCPRLARSDDHQGRLWQGQARWRRGYCCRPFSRSIVVLLSRRGYGVCGICGTQLLVRRGALNLLRTKKLAKSAKKKTS